MLICTTTIVKNSLLRSPFMDMTDYFLCPHIRREVFIDGFIRQGFQLDKSFLSSYNADAPPY
jgi:hypothetical protein